MVCGIHVPVLKVSGRDCCCETWISVCCVVMICGVVVTIATCGIMLLVGCQRLAVRVDVVCTAELDGVCETGV